MAPLGGQPPPPAATGAYDAPPVGLNKRAFVLIQRSSDRGAQTEELRQRSSEAARSSAARTDLALLMPPPTLK